MALYAALQLAARVALRALRRCSCRSTTPQHGFVWNADQAARDRRRRLHVVLDAAAQDLLISAAARRASCASWRIWMLASTLWALDQKASLAFCRRYGGLMLLYAVISMVPISPAQFRMLLLLVVVGGLCAAAFGAHMFYHDPPFSQENLGDAPAHRASRKLSHRPESFRRRAVVSDCVLDVGTAHAIVARPRWLHRRLGAVDRRHFVGRFARRIDRRGARSSSTTSDVRATGFGSPWRIAGVALLASPRCRRRCSCVLPALCRPAAPGARRSGRSPWKPRNTASLQGLRHRQLRPGFNVFYLKVHQPYPYGWDSPAHNVILHYLVELGI